MKEDEKILRARAAALAKPQRGGKAHEQIEVVEFLLAHEKYGIESRYIHEVYPLREFTHIPCTPPFVSGIINVRGEIISVVDIRKFFELPDKGLTDLNKVIIIFNDKMKFGILADAIIGMRSIPLGELQLSLPTLTGIRAEYLKGVTQEPLVVLDAETILSDRKIEIHEEV